MFKKINRASLGHFAVAFVFLVLVFVILIGRCNEAYGQKKGGGYPYVDNMLPTGIVKNGFEDSIPKYQYQLRFEQNYFVAKFDSIERYIFQYVGSSLSKDDYIKVQNLYFELKYRLLTSAKKDTVEIPKELRSKIGNQ